MSIKAMRSIELGPLQPERGDHTSACASQRAGNLGRLGDWEAEDNAAAPDAGFSLLLREADQFVEDRAAEARKQSVPHVDIRREAAVLLDTEAQGMVRTGIHSFIQIGSKRERLALAFAPR